MFLLPGEKIGPYRVLDVIGTGATGVVYQVVHSETGEERAVKLLAQEIAEAAHEELVLRYKQEARVAGGLKHPGLIPVYGFGEHQGVPYIVMEHRSAPTLAKRIKQGPVPLEEAIQIIRQLADALKFVHAHGIVHRDIKPTNILYDDKGQTTLIDFGIARLRGSSLTRVGTIMGALGYCAPEQIQASHRVDHRADLFALGVLFYTLLSGKKPFAADSMERFTEAVLHEDPPPPSALVPGLPPEIDAIVTRLLAKKPEDRYPDADALLEDLARLSFPQAPNSPQKLDEEKRAGDE